MFAASSHQAGDEGRRLFHGQPCGVGHHGGIFIWAARTTNQVLSTTHTHFSSWRLGV